MNGIYIIHTATLPTLYIYADTFMNALTKAKRWLRDRGHSMSVQRPRAEPKPATAQYLQQHPEALHKAWEFAQATNERDSSQHILLLSAEALNPRHDFDKVQARLTEALRTLA